MISATTAAAAAAASEPPGNASERPNPGSNARRQRLLRRRARRRKPARPMALARPEQLLPLAAAHSRECQRGILRTGGGGRCRGGRSSAALGGCCGPIRGRGRLSPGVGGLEECNDGCLWRFGVRSTCLARKMALPRCRKGWKVGREGVKGGNKIARLSRLAVSHQSTSGETHVALFLGPFVGPFFSGARHWGFF